MKKNQAFAGAFYPNVYALKGLRRSPHCYHHASETLVPTRSGQVDVSQRLQGTDFGPSYHSAVALSRGSMPLISRTQVPSVGCTNVACTTRLKPNRHRQRYQIHLTAKAALAAVRVFGPDFIHVTYNVVVELIRGRPCAVDSSCTAVTERMNETL